MGTVGVAGQFICAVRRTGKQYLEKLSSFWHKNHCVQFHLITYRDHDSLLFVVEFSIGRLEIRWYFAEIIGILRWKFTVTLGRD